MTGGYDRNDNLDSTELLVPGSGSWRLATGLLPQLLSTIMRAACTDIYSEVTLMVRWYNDILEWSSTLTPKVGALLAACRRLDTYTQSPPSTLNMAGSIAMTICNICDLSVIIFSQSAF